MTTGKVIRREWITRRDVRSNPDRTYLFGDNMARTGMGGQAAEMRGEPNTIGVPTKWRPGKDPSDFFSDGQIYGPARMAIDRAFADAAAYLELGFDVVIPADGLGTGLSELPTRAPMLFAYIERKIAALEALGRDCQSGEPS